jgi:hypothetical protein
MRRVVPFLTSLGIASLGAAYSAPSLFSTDPVDAAAFDQPQAVPAYYSAAKAADSAAEPFTDHRAWQHGINLLKVGDRHLLVWSSWGETPKPIPNPEGNWAHDVYYSWIDPNNPVIQPNTLVTGPEAQEPASAAVDTNGHILMSCEDGNPDINQRYGLWTTDLKPMQEYGTMIRQGGHSGHVAAMGDRFVAAYSEEWIDGGGVDNLGTGDDVWARIVNDDGSLSPEIPVSVSKDPNRRDWWPEIASSGTDALEVWQRYPSDTLWGSFVHADATCSPEFQITDNIKYYVYNVSWIPTLKLYAVFGTRSDGGFVSLIDRNGKVVQTRTGLPETVRESRLLARRDGRNSVTAVYPAMPSGMAVLHITPDRVDLRKTVDDDYEWDYTGTDGMFLNRNRALFATLSKTGVRMIDIDF